MNEYMRMADRMYDLENQFEQLKKKNEELERKLEQTEKDLADYQFNYPTIKELEKENAELKEELTKKADTNHSLVEQMADLESENAELKSKNKWYSEQVCYKECAEVWGNLTKATDLLKKMYYLYFDPCVTEQDLENRDKLLEETEQFLKEIEK